MPPFNPFQTSPWGYTFTRRREYNGAAPWFKVALRLARRCPGAPSSTLPSPSAFGASSVDPNAWAPTWVRNSQVHAGDFHWTRYPRAPS